MGAPLPEINTNRGESTLKNKEFGTELPVPPTSNRLPPVENESTVNEEKPKKRKKKKKRKEGGGENEEDGKRESQNSGDQTNDQEGEE
jgi:hypothetical protein